jgi:hypothetical protein
VLHFKLETALKMRFATFVPVIALLTALHVNAQPSPEKIALAEQLTQLLKVNDSFAAYLKECANPDGSMFDPKVAFRADPGSFGGVSPQSAYWPEIKSIYARFQTTTCAYATPEKFTQFYIEQFAERMTVEDMRASIEFNSSQAGKRLQAAVLATTNEFQPFASKLMFKAYEVARDQFHQEVRVVLRKYKAEPK